MRNLNLNLWRQVHNGSRKQGYEATVVKIVPRMFGLPLQAGWPYYILKILLLTNAPKKVQTLHIHDAGRTVHNLLHNLACVIHCVHVGIN